MQWLYWCRASAPAKRAEAADTPADSPTIILLPPRLVLSLRLFVRRISAGQRGALTGAARVVLPEGGHERRA
jgi:hypothetical protein